MTDLAVTPARTEDDVANALTLAVSVFETASGLTGYAPYKSALWFEDPSFNADNLMLARIGAGPPCGLVRIVPRTVYRAGQEFLVAGISSVCLAPEQRGKGLSVVLLERTIEHCSERSFDFAFLFARRAADHYYTRFGFWGIASYSRLSIALGDLAADARLTLSHGDEAHIGLYRATYDRCYAGTFGRVARSPEYWRFLLRRVQHLPGIRFSTLLESGSPVGYTIWSDSAVHELAFLDGVQAARLVGVLADIVPGARERNSLTFELQPQHVFVHAAYGLDMTFSARECPYGGHMARILNPRALIDRIGTRSPAAAARLAHLGQANALAHRDTCRLLGAWSPTDPGPFDDQVLPYDMSVSDHF